MRLFPAELEIEDNEGFSEEKDIFQREKIGNGLTNILTSVSDPCVVAVDGSWGSGKSVFLKMWAGELRNDGIPVIYFDAFKNDYFDDAFIAIVGEIINLAIKQSGEKSSADEFKSKALAVFKIFALAGSKKLIEHATFGVIGDEEVKDITDAITETKGLEKQFDEILKSYGNSHDVLEAFKKTLSDLPEVLGEGEEGEEASDKNKKPLIIIIDELDRCRPDFALQILERIKHLFSVPNVHFVLGVHLEQLENSVKYAYGGGIDAHTYLQKFIHFTVALTTNNFRYREMEYATYMEHIIGQFDFNTADKEFINIAKEMILKASERESLSFRTIERLLTKICILTRYSRVRNHQNHLVSGLCILNVTNPGLFKKAKAGGLQFSEVEKALGLSLIEDSQWGEITELWRYYTDYSFSQEDAEKIISFQLPPMEQR
ncbi:MAG: hypothetical protein COA84_10255, partial [Robiginitomaculum sp.]